MDAPRPTSDQPEKHEAGDGNHAPQSTSELAADEQAAIDRLTTRRDTFPPEKRGEYLTVRYGDLDVALALVARITDLEAQVDVEAWCKDADEALAGPDTPADSQEDKTNGEGA